MIKLAPYSFSLSVTPNANYADGVLLSWIWDADFEQITRMDIQKSMLAGYTSAQTSGHWLSG